MNRRQYLWQSGGGLGGIALTSMLGLDRLEGVGAGPILGQPHHPAKAKRVVQLFMAGAASHIDLFDYKPALIKHHGEKSDFGEPVEAFQNGLGPWMKPVWEFKPYGKSGKMLGETVSKLGEVVDDMAFVHNLVGKTGVHSQATYLQSTGFDRPGFPGMGCWVSYGLGSMNNNLPTFVVLQITVDLLQMVPRIGVQLFFLQKIKAQSFVLEPPIQYQTSIFPPELTIFPMPPKLMHRAYCPDLTISIFKLDQAIHD